ncbi:Deoxyribodipyrimidine photo-lyase [Fasciola gigantica]|uniref:Deoxyribodipyrimidine photo-lyase n=1 Tax=Fasciola gigantica TaxID=46835 RepID=A0A504YSZ4_FASGI|nr:Deoxyribodipyrimidine photo-lyase [Fasciola gigantica]
MASENSFLTKIEKKRANTAKSVLDFKFAKSRIRHLHGPEEFPGLVDESESAPMSVLYWMIRDQRVQDNWAMLYAQRLALKFRVPLHVCFCLAPCYQADTLRHLSFMLSGLVEVEQECRSLNIPFHLVNADNHLGPDENRKSGVQARWSPNYTTSSSAQIYDAAVAQAIGSLVTSLHIGCLVVDFSPLRAPSAWVESAVRALPEDIPVCQVDAHNIVPVWCGSDKLESHARTIRPKLFSKTVKYLTEFPPVITHPFQNEMDTNCQSMIDWHSIKANHFVDSSVDAVTWAIPGTKAAFEVLRSFIEERLKGFDAQRNNPANPALSGLSPWFHFAGQISPQRSILEVSAVRKSYVRSADIFIEEAFNRRELAENFCFYNRLYDCLQGAREWARETLMKHAKDKRLVAYTRKQLENGETADDLWNAAQKQLVHTGKMHGFLRQYWAKKILEWCAEGPQTAIDWAVYLNDRFSLDGTDPNGYVGIMWAICGIHDQGWNERAVFGKVRCMTYNGCKKWFSIPEFVKRFTE